MLLTLLDPRLLAVLWVGSLWLSGTWPVLIAVTLRAGPCGGEHRVSAAFAEGPVHLAGGRQLPRGQQRDRKCLAYLVRLVRSARTAWRLAREWQAICWAGSAHERQETHRMCQVRHSEPLFSTRRQVGIHQPRDPRKHRRARALNTARAFTTQGIIYLHPLVQCAEE